MTKGRLCHVPAISNPIFAVVQFANWRCHVTYICDFEFTTSGLDFLGFDFLGPYKATWSTSLLPFSFNQKSPVCLGARPHMVAPWPAPLGEICGLRQRSCPQYLDWVSRSSAGVTLWRAGTNQKRRRFIENQQDYCSQPQNLWYGAMSQTQLLQFDVMSCFFSACRS